MSSEIIVADIDPERRCTPRHHDMKKKKLRISLPVQPPMLGQHLSDNGLALLAALEALVDVDTNDTDGD